MRLTIIFLLIGMQLGAQSQIGLYYQGTVSNRAQFRSFDIHEPVYYHNLGIRYDFKTEHWLYSLSLEHLQLGAKTWSIGYTLGSSVPKFFVTESTYYHINSSLNALRKLFASAKFEIHAGLGLNLGHAYADSWRRFRLDGGNPRNVSSIWDPGDYLNYNFYLAPELALRFEYHINESFSCIFAPEYSYQIREDLDYLSHSVFQFNTGLLYNL
ncbi:hypothetical protein [Croceimicrobium hydrocarbonivorans]|uniref:Uncharacterized protein n=1 Tax=Croceimicrobium hydrocarbonivorans TaxID=2761580 RepID=A0A7H0VHH7_9FLAO|nr:hypothetical protein [Croceimicrobium hydrocarbonivorans]QNR25175.1 hypothetical protein H4K34_04870 [Croceimicrobium hydrocarbonivorans]